MSDSSTSKLIEAKTDELHYLDQVYKYMKYLEHTYKAGCLKDKEKALQIDISLRNINKQRDTLKKEIKKLYETMA